MTLAVDPSSEMYECPKPGRYRHVPFADYLRWDAVNWSTLKPGRKSALEMIHAINRPTVSSRSMDKGSAIDCLVFDGEKAFDLLFAAMPAFPGDPRSNKHKEAKAEWVKDHADFGHLSRQDMADVRGMYDALRAHPIAWPLLTSGKGKSQLSIVWQDEKTGLTCKGRPDRIAEVESSIIDPSLPKGHKTIVLIDLKSTVEPGVDFYEFANEVAKFGYHGQLAHYESGCKTLSPADILPIIVAPQNVEPYDVVVHRLDGDAGDGRTVIEHGRALARRLLDMYSLGMKTDRWPGQCSTINALTLPSRAREPEQA